MWTKVTLPFHSEASTLWKLCGSCAANIHRRTNWGKFAVCHINGLEANLYVAAFIAIYEYMYVNSRREGGSLELNYWKYEQGTSFPQFGEENSFFYFFALIPPFISNPCPFPRQFEQEAQNFCAWRSLCLIRTHTCTEYFQIRSPTHGFLTRREISLLWLNLCTLNFSKAHFND